MTHPIQTIGVFAPSSYVERTDIEKSKSVLENRGYQVHVHPQTYARHHQSAGTESEKAGAFHALWNDPAIDVLWAAGGGNRCLHLLPHLNIANLKNPKPVIGFSDVTVLLNALYAQAHIPAIHGQVFKNVYKHTELDQLLSLLTGEAQNYPVQNCTTINQGTASGPLIGGNLSVFQYLPAAFKTKFWDNTILFLEDTGEEYSAFDRTMRHLKNLGILDDISGLIFGNFANWKDSGRPYGFSFEEIVAEHTEGLDIPIIANAPFGHTGPFYALPVGARASLHALEDISLTIEPSSVFA